MTIKYDTEIEVTAAQYSVLTTHLAGIVAHRQEAGKYYIKVLLMKYSKYVKQILSK